MNARIASRVASVLIGLSALTACRGSTPTSEVPRATPTSWIDAPLLGERPEEVEDLRVLAEQGLVGRTIRLDRLLDLFDAARFAADEYARETLWAALGGHPVGIGSEATRDATARMLEEALAVDSAARSSGSLDAESLEWLAEAIQLLSADLERPASAQMVSIATSAHRMLAESGHPRIADNARWRLYDHARGTLEAATRAAPGRRADIAVQALYVERESVEPLLADGPSARPHPSPETLWSVVESQRAALAKESRWAPVVRERAAQDDALRRTVAAVLPAVRDPDWRAPVAEPGVARADTGGPVVRVRSGVARVDAGRPQARSVRIDSDTGDPARALEEALGATLSADGRGSLLLVMDPDLPSPQVHTTLRAVRRAQTSRVDLAVVEPGVGLRALPLVVARSADGTHELAALRSARVAVRLDGRGMTWAVDDEALIADVTTGPELRAWTRTLGRAYPRERIVRLTLGPDVSVRQLAELLAALEGGDEPPFEAVGWWAGGSSTLEPSRPAHDRRVQRRANLGRATIRLEQPYPLEDHDQRRLEAFAQEVATCLPELEIALERAASLGVTFAQGQFESVSTDPVRAPAPRRQAFERCVMTAAGGVRLRQHLDRIDMTLVVTPLI